MMGAGKDGDSGPMGTSIRHKRRSKNSSRVDPALELRKNQSVMGSSVLDMEAVDMVGENKLGTQDWRGRLAYLLATSKMGMALDSLNTLFSLVSCLLHIGETYATDDKAIGAFVKFDFAITCVFLLDYLLHLFAAPKFLDALLCVSSLIEIVTIQPGFIAFAMYPDHYKPEELKEELSVLSFVIFLRLLRIFRVLRMQRLLSFAESEIKRQIYAMTLYVLCLVYFAAGLVHLLENTKSLYADESEYRSLSFFDVIYLTVTTITTVGYGDIAPKTQAGRAAIMSMMFTALVIVPRQTNKLIALMGMTSVYARQSYQPTKQSSHVLVAGNINGRGIIDFFREFFHPDHGNSGQSAVVIGHGLPTEEIRGILSDPRYAYMITYLDGNVMNERDLKRAAVSTADAVFFLTNKFTQTPAQEDASCILQALSIQRYAQAARVQSSRKDRLTVCMQLTSKESHQLFESSSKQVSGHDLFSSQIVCIDEIKMNILSKSCLVPGLITMINNLIASSDENDTMNKAKPWVEEYVDGVGFEIYRVQVSTFYTGLEFREFARLVYETTGTLVFGLEVTHIKAGTRIVLNPGSYVLPQQHEGLAIFALMLASDLAEAMIMVSQNLVTAVAQKTANVPEDQRDEVMSQQELFASIKKQVGGPHEIKLERFNSESKLEVLEEPPAPETKSMWSNASKLLKPKTRKRDGKMQERYFVLEQPNLFEDMHITSVHDVFDEDFCGHFIVIGFPSHLYNFILPLRERKLGTATPIIIMSPVAPTESEWQSLAMFEDIYFLRGSPLDIYDLERVKVSTASRAILFTKAYKSDQYRNRESLVDADTIFAYSILKKENPNLDIIAELVVQSNINFIADAEDVQSSDAAAGESSTGKHVLLPPFAAGNIYTSSMLDTLLAQSYYNSNLITALHQLVVGEDLEKAQEWKKKSNISIQGSDLGYIPVPPSFDGKTYMELFTNLVASNVLPMAIRRGLTKNNTVGKQGNVMPYIVTNPKGDSILHAEDFVFVLSTETFVFRDKICAKKISQGPKVTQDTTSQKFTALQHRVESEMSSISKNIAKLITQVEDMK